MISDSIQKQPWFVTKIDELTKENERLKAIHSKDGMGLNPYHLLVLMGGYLRLFHKGLPPDVAMSIDDQEGINYTAHCDFANKVVKICKRTNAYDSSRSTDVETFEYTKEQIEGLV